MRKCALCGKGSMMSGVRKKLRGKYNPVNWKREYPNLQYARLPLPAGKAVGGQAKVDGIRKLICTQCIRTLNKKARPSRAK